MLQIEDVISCTESTMDYDFLWPFRVFCAAKQAKIVFIFILDYYLNVRYYYFLALDA